MKFFSKKRDENFYSDNGEMQIYEDVLPLSDKRSKSPDAITPDELLSFKAEEITKSNSNAMESLRKKVESINAARSDFEITSEPQDLSSNAPDVYPKTFETTEKSNEAEASCEPQFNEAANSSEEDNFQKDSLLKKCRPFIIDDEGNEAVNEEPLYKLQSVADILRTDSERTLESLYENYDISIDDLGKSPYLTPLNFDSKDINENAEKPKTEPEPITVKNIQSSVPIVISDIDVGRSTAEVKESAEQSPTSTITFTPISSGDAFGSKIAVSTKTQPIDLTGELARLPKDLKQEDTELHLEKNEFEEFNPKEEVTDDKSALKWMRRLSIKKRNAFLTSVLSVILTLCLAFFKLPFMNGPILADTKSYMIIALSLTGLTIVANAGMFAALIKLFGKNSTPDVSASLAAIITVAYAVLGIINGENILNMLILLSVILSFRSLGGFYKASYVLSGIKKIGGSRSKKAVKLISNPAITFAMAKNSIEGDVLIAAPQDTVGFNDFIKFSTFGSFLGGKHSIITLFSVILSAITGVATAFYFDGALFGLYAAAAIQCFVSLPFIFLIDNLPLYRANKKLARKGGAIIGKSGALQLEMANAVLLNSNQLFPKGSVTLHQMKVLSENDLQDTLLRAASLTEALDSPLAPVLKEIAGTAQIESLPNSDTVKYEDRMGISGWVDDRLLFIGNRTLMEAHGIEVPNVDFDRRILRQGFFPVYVATRDTACAVLIIKYSANLNIARELVRLTNAGITLLINNSDQNLTEEMICDYLGLYNDSVKVMSAAGCHMYKNTVLPAERVSSPAVFSFNPLALPMILNCAGRFKRSNTILTIAYILSAALGTVIFTYSSFGGSGSLISDSVILLFSLISTVATYLIYLIQRP